MSQTIFTICEYCDTQNPKIIKLCQACGAPIEFHPPDLEPTIPDKKTGIKNRLASSSEEEIRKATQKLDGAYFTVMNTYAIAWRTVGEGIAIAVSAFIIGCVGGTTRMVFWSILGAIAVGIAVGITQKNFYVALISTPGAAILGLFMGAIFWISGNPKGAVFIVTIFAVFGAILGGRRRPAFNSRNWWEKLRPILGAVGGLVFGILGALLGLGITGTIELFR
jgi:hypothetical protein